MTKYKCIYYYQQWVDLLCAKQHQQQQSLSNVCTVAVLIVWLCVLCCSEDEVWSG